MKTIIIKPIDTIALAKKITPIIWYDMDVKFLKIYATNNANDETPCWEEITTEFLNKTDYFFKNTTLTASKGAISIKIILDYAYTGAFDASVLEDYNGNIAIEFDDTKVNPKFKIEETQPFIYNSESSCYELNINTKLTDSELEIYESQYTKEVIN